MLSSVSLRHLRAFVAVAEYGSFTDAAKSLGLTPPTLTATIRQFEDVIGMALFDRTTRQVSLSAGGARFLPTARRLIDDFQTALGDLDAQSRGIGGKVVLAAAPSVLTRLLPPIIAQFNARHPDVTLRLDELNAGEAHEAVAAGEVDFGIAGDWRALPDIDFIPLFSDRLGLVCRRDNPLSEKSEVTWEDLRDQRFVGLGPESGTGAMLARADLLGGTMDELSQSPGKRHGVGPTKRKSDGREASPSVTTTRPVTTALASALRPVVETSNTITLEAMVAANIGITILPELAARVADNPALAFVPLVDPVRERHIGVITRHSRSLSPVARIFLDFVLDRAPQTRLPADLRWHAITRDN